MPDFERSVSITLSKDTTDLFAGDWLKLVQPEFVTGQSEYNSLSEWMYNSGIALTSENMATYLDQYSSACDEDGTLVVEIQVHRSRQDLEYTLTATYGELSDVPVTTEGSVKTSYSVKLEDNIELDSVPNGEVNAFWEGSVYNGKGEEVLPAPDITYSDGYLVFDEPYLGSVRVEYWNIYDAYTLTIVPRDDDDNTPDDRETAYQSTVNAIWGDGNLESLDVDLPDMTGGCGRPSTFIDPDEPDSEKCYKHVVLYDPCTLDIVEEFDEQISCEEEDEDKVDLGEDE